MARYRLKRRTYGVVDTTSNVLGSAVQGVSNGVGTVAEKVGGAMDSKVVGMASTIPGAVVGGMMGGPLGMIAGGALGSAAVRGVGAGVKALGESMQS